MGPRFRFCFFWLKKVSGCVVNTISGLCSRVQLISDDHISRSKSENVSPVKRGDSMEATSPPGTPQQSQTGNFFGSNLHPPKGVRQETEHQWWPHSHTHQLFKQHLLCWKAEVKIDDPCLQKPAACHERNLMNRLEYILPASRNRWRCMSNTSV